MEAHCESNKASTDYDYGTLINFFAQRKEKRLTLLKAVFFILAGCLWIEPTTNGLKVRSSQ